MKIISTLKRIAAAVALGAVLAAVTQAAPARAAGGAFAVDNAGIDRPGDCKVEAFASLAQTGDRVFALAPGCVVSLGRPVDLGLQFDRTRSGGEWGSGLALKAKTAIVPFGDDARIGVAIAGGGAFDLTARQLAEWFFTVPVSIRLSEIFQINLNGGAVWDRVEDRGFVTWGVGFELALAIPFTLLGEIFGQGSDNPGAQLGLRYTPHEKIDLDLIYGRNLAGERADWVTLGVNLRF